MLNFELTKRKSKDDIHFADLYLFFENGGIELNLYKEDIENLIKAIKEVLPNVI